MINLDEIIGDIIFISFRDSERLKDLGVTESSGHYSLKGYDQMGLWLEHPGIVIIRVEDESGNPLPVAEQSKENIAANFVVTWDNVNTIMCYPEREGFDLPNKFNKNFGFRFEHEEKTTG